MVAAEAFFFLQDCVASGSVRAVHLFFPDPWPKKRHHKRRLVQTNFLQEVARVLVDGGRLSIVTDHRDYFAQIEGVVAASPLRRANFEPPPGAAEGELAGTNFERKYRRQGRELLVLAALKEPAP
jgi:tRNA (guanine-N7-)-methyltransferase